MSRERRKVLQGKIDALLDADLLEPTHSEWGSTKPISTQKGWVIAVSYRLSRFEQKRSKDIVAAPTHSRCSGRTRGKYLFYLH